MACPAHRWQLDELEHSVAASTEAGVLRAPGGSVGEASAFGSGHDPKVLGPRPAPGALLNRELASLSPSASPLPLK